MVVQSSRNPIPPTRSRLMFPRRHQMSDFPDSTQHVSPAAAFNIENFQKKNGTSAGNSIPTNTARQNFLNSNSSLSSSSVKETSTSSQVVNSSTTTRVEKKSQRLVTSSSSTSSSTSSTSERKATALKRDLSEIKNSMSEINDLAMGRTTTTTTKTTTHPIEATSPQEALNEFIRKSMENLVDAPGDGSPLVTFPDSDGHEDLSIANLKNIKNELANGSAITTSNNGTLSSTVKFEEKRSKSESKTKVMTDGVTTEQETSESAQMKRLQAGDIDYKEAKATSAVRNRLEMDGITAEQNAAQIQEARSLRAGDVTQQQSNNIAAGSIKVQSDTFSAEKKAIAQQQTRQTMTSHGIISQEKQFSSASQSNYTSSSKSVSSSNSSSIGTSITHANALAINAAMTTYQGFLDKFLNDREKLDPITSSQALDRINDIYALTKDFDQHYQTSDSKSTADVVNYMNDLIIRAWQVPTYGHELGYSLCNSLRQNGGLDLLMKNCVEGDDDTKFSSAKLLEQCLTTENRSHVVENGLEKVVDVAVSVTKKAETDHSRVGTGILEHLFKHSEGTCSDVIKLGGLDAVLFECRRNDVETLRHCAGALANLSLYGGAENQETMISRKVPMWLFPLAFHDDDNIKYYACLAIAVLVANKEIEAEVLKSGTLGLVEPFVTTHNPSEFAKSNLAHAHGQSKHWLERLVPVLSSNREEARNLAAFHFCMEAGIKKEQKNTDIFREIGAIEPLKNVASCPNAIASKFAAQALRLIGETVPHKLSQQVPLWSVEDVQEWVKQIGFDDFAECFYSSKVDGDLLLQLNEKNLKEDIGITNGILRQRFIRELLNLKKLADYSSKDSSKIHFFLDEIGPEYCTYTYAMLNAGVDDESLRQLNDDMLIEECGIHNSIHRLRILNAVKAKESIAPGQSSDKLAKTLDVFVSYRRKTGSQLASLLKVHLQLRGYTVFIDVERLEAGKFDNGLLNSIGQARNFLLVLTPAALNRCIGDHECKDWVHREIVAAIQANCNIIPIIDNFNWPDEQELPIDMQSISKFNAVNWIHDYQDACIEKIERFLDKSLERQNFGSVNTLIRDIQRLHSHDSEFVNVNGGQSGGLNNSSGQAAASQRLRKTSSPSRHYHTHNHNNHHGVAAYGTFGRGGSRNFLPPYRSQHLVGKSGSGSLNNVGAGPRRGSAVNTSARAPINTSNTSFGGRSHSLDGLLDEDGNPKTSKSSVNKNVHDNTEDRGSGVEIRDSKSNANKTPNRKSRSLGHLLNELEPIETQLEDLNTKSMVLLPAHPAPLATQESDKLEEPPVQKKPTTNDSHSSSVTPDRNLISRRTPEGMSSASEDVDYVDDRRKSTSSGGSSRHHHHPSTLNKSFMNRAVKKVRSMIKK
ncbi:SARM1 family protein [Megaselia abdita]